MNLIKNGSFESGWRDIQAGVNLINQEPHRWTLYTHNEFGTPECVHKLAHQLPPNERPNAANALILDGTAVYKLFRGAGRWSATLSQTVRLERGRMYQLTVPVQCHWQRDKPWERDVTRATVNLFVDDVKVATVNGADRQWLYASATFEALADSVTIDIEFNGNPPDGVGVDWFVDHVQLAATGNSAENGDDDDPTYGFAYYTWERNVAAADAADLLGGSGILVPLVAAGDGSGGANAAPDYVPYSQRDPRWAAARIGHSAETIGNYGCLVTAFATIATTHAETVTPAELNRKFTAVGAYIGANTRWNALSMLYPSLHFVEVLETHGSMSRVDAYLDQGDIVVARVDADPSTMAWEQHWVLLTGRDASGYTIINPWRGTRERLTDYYDRSGPDIHTVIVYRSNASAPRPQRPALAGMDLQPYILAVNDRRYRVRSNDGRQETFWSEQTAPNEVTFWKNQLYEKWLLDGRHIRLWRDTSPAPQDDGTARYYVVTGNDGRRGGRWCLRTMRVGQTYDEAADADPGHYVQFYAKSDHRPLAQNSGHAANSTTLIEHMVQWRSPYGPVLDDVIRIGRPGGEVHLFARGVGRVGWESPWQSSAFLEWV